MATRRLSDKALVSKLDDNDTLVAVTENGLVRRITSDRYIGNITRALGFDSNKKPISLYNSVRGVVASNDTWGTGSERYRHIAIPVLPGDDIKIVSNIHYRTPIAFLRTYNLPEPGVSGVRADFSLEEGYTSRITTVLSKVNHYIVPSDVNYIIVNVLDADEDYSPSSFKINGYDICMPMIPALLEALNIVTDIVKPLIIEKVDTGFYITSGAIRLFFRLNGNNSIFNLYAGWFGSTVLFVSGTDWFGPYRVEKDGGSSDFEDLFTTGGNHVITTEGGDVIYTGETVSFSGYCDGVECLDNGVYRAHRFVMTWHNTVLAGNDIKYNGNTPFLDEYYHVVIEPGMIIKVDQHFIPRQDGRLRWYSGLQFAGGSFAPDILIPAYSHELVKTSEIAGITINDKQVDYIKAVGEVVSLEMEIDRSFDLGLNCKNAQVTGNSGKAYLVLQNAYDEPLQLNKDNVYSWRGLYRFMKSY